MKVQNINQTHFLNFAAKKLFNVKLQQSIDLEPLQSLDARIIQLDTSDADRDDLQEEYWEDETLGKDLISDFRKKREYQKLCPKHWDKINFYAIETNTPNEENEIVSLAEISESSRDIRLIYLQTLHPIELLRVIKGGGSCLLYMAQQLAERLEKAEISVNPKDNAIDFYAKKNGFLSYGDGDYYLPQSKFAEFKKRLEEKYSITPVS